MWTVFVLHAKFLVLKFGQLWGALICVTVFTNLIITLLASFSKWCLSIFTLSCLPLITHQILSDLWNINAQRFKMILIQLCVIAVLYCSFQPWEAVMCIGKKKLQRIMCWNNWFPITLTFRAPLCLLTSLLSSSSPSSPKQPRAVLSNVYFLCLVWMNCILRGDQRSL